MADRLAVVAGDGQEADRGGGHFAPLVVRLVSEADGTAVAGEMASFFVDDPQGTGTDFHGGSPVRVTTAVDGTASTDVALVAGGGAGPVTVRMVASAATGELALHVRRPCTCAHCRTWAGLAHAPVPPLRPGARLPGAVNR